MDYKIVVKNERLIKAKLIFVAEERRDRSENPFLFARPSKGSG